MGKTPFKMRGYSYPGISPVKQKELTPETVKEQNKFKADLLKFSPSYEAHFDTTSVGNFSHPDAGAALSSMGFSEKDINVIHKQGEPGGRMYGVNPHREREDE